MKKNRDVPLRRSPGALFLPLLSVLVFLAAAWGLHLWRAHTASKEEARNQEMALTQARINAKELKELLKRREARAPLAAAGESVVAFLEAQATGSGIAKEKIQAITPGDARKISDNYKEAIIKVRLEGISLKELVSYLFNIQTAKRETGLHVKGFHLEADRKSPHKWQATIDLASLTYEPVKKAIGSE